MVDDSDFRPSSPVPQDQFLWADEKPFTEFGQFGEGSLDNRVFCQDVWWVNIKGEAFLLTEMPTDYLRNVLTFLFKNQERFYTKSILSYAIDKVLVSLASCEVEMNLDISQMPADREAYVEFIDNLPNPVEQYSSPGEWLADTPLVKKILVLLNDRESSIE